ncbi:MAG: isochorismatase family protein [Clostridia bacterium]|nr:isochorismatase family protein [Clostridia bacterium]
MQEKALVVIDIQNDITKNYKEIICNINDAVDWAVNNDIHVVYIKHNKVVDSYEEMVKSASILKEHNYIIMSEKDSRISLTKGYTEDGFAEKVFHIHIRLKGDIGEVYFKDYLIAHHQVAKEYENLKLKLWEEYEYNRDAYTDAKTSFVKIYTDIAKQNC